MVDDEALYALVMRGDETALAELVARYHSPIYKFLHRYTGDAALADDLAQETFIRLLQFHGQPPQRFKPWVYTIATNIARDYFRSASFRHENTISFTGDERAISSSTSMPENDSMDVKSALLRLTPEHREVLLLRFYHDLKLDEIAEVTGTPVGTVKSRLFHALKWLKGFLAVTEIAYDRE